MREKLSKANQSVEKVFQIIETMVQHNGPMRLQDISNLIGMPSSTVLRLLNTLAIYNYVNQDAETSKYSLSMKFAQIGSLVSSQNNLRNIAHRFLVDLSNKCHESTCLAIEEDREVVYIDLVDGPDNMLRTTQRVGKRAPMHSTGVGKLMLLNYDNQQLDKLISIKGLPALTHKTLTTREDLVSSLHQARANNYALDNEECELGVRCIATPIRDYTGRVIAGISVSGPITRLSMDRINTLKDTVIATGEKISSLMAYKKDFEKKL